MQKNRINIRKLFIMRKNAHDVGAHAAKNSFAGNIWKENTITLLFPCEKRGQCYAKLVDVRRRRGWRRKEPRMNDDNEVCLETVRRGVVYRLVREEGNGEAYYTLYIHAGSESCRLPDIGRRPEGARRVLTDFSRLGVRPCTACEVVEDLLARDPDYFC